VNATKATGRMRALSHQAVARGADGVLFFQWRQSRAGAEQFHTAMLPHAGTRSRIWREVVALGDELDRLRTVAGTENPRARVALLFDWDSWWAVEGEVQPRTHDYLAALETWYRPLHAANVPVDLLHPDADLTGYDLVIAQHVHVLPESVAASLGQFVHEGGTLLVGYGSGIVDEHLHAYLDGYLGPLQQVLGLRVEEFAPLPDRPHPDAATTVRSADLGDFGAALWSEIVETSTATTVATFTHPDLAGGPAVTRNDHGRGQAWYVATAPDYDGARAIVDRVLDVAGVEREHVGLPAGVEAVRRGGHLVLTNQTAGPVDVDVAGSDLLGATVAGGRIRLAPYGTAVVGAGG
jgi:beta-galactosidase